MSRRLTMVLGALALVGCGAGSAEPRETSRAPDPPLSRPVEPGRFEPEPIALSLASTVWPPFTDREGESRVAIELVHEALSRAGYEARTTVLGPDVDTDEHLRDEEFDGSPAVWRTKERESYLRFSEPFLENRIVLVGREGADVDVSSLAELEGSRIGIVAGYAYGEQVRQVEGPELVEGASTSGNLGRLLDEELDYVLADDLVINYLLELHPDDAKRVFTIGTEPIARRTLHLAIHEDHPHAAQIIARFDREAQRMRGDGTYHRILHLRWLRADVDGDGELELVLDGDKAGEAPPERVYRVAPGENSSGDTVYRVDGRRYDSWESMPAQYEVPAAAPPPGHYGIGSDFGMSF